MEVGQYIVNTGVVLGKGAFGIIHTAFASNGEEVAAKRIDGKNPIKMQKVTKDLEKLHKLKHKNIVKVLDVYQEETVIWVMMELCDKGDLTSYIEAQSTKITDTESLNIMLGIAQGVDYLHNKNVIHRDIKPENILLSRGILTVAKLTDFDLSKFLEEGYDTSVMTTDVGTRAYKAPEFWKRTADGKLNYHRNVDVYAMGLTFLAMVQGKKKLCPTIETPLDASELHQPIGALIAERIRFKIEPLEIISDNISLSLSPKQRKIRCLVQKMTKVQPKERLQAKAVVKELTKIVVS